MRSRVLVLFALLMLSAVAIARADRHEIAPDRPSFIAFPTQIGAWSGTPRPPFDDDVLRVLGMTDYLTRLYSRADRASVDLYIGYWATQRQGQTIHSPQNCLPGSGWQPIAQSTMYIADPEHPTGARRPINRYLIQRGSDRQLVLYWFQSHGRILASEYWSKFYLIADAVRMNRSDGAIVRVIAPIVNDTPAGEADAESLALSFVGALLPHLDGFLPK